MIRGGERGPLACGVWRLAKHLAKPSMLHHTGRGSGPGTRVRSSILNCNVR